MSNDFATYEQAQALKELGFDERDILKIIGNGQGLFNNDAPLTQQALRFFREKFGLFGIVGVDTDDYKDYAFRICGQNISEVFVKGFDTYEEAESQLINRLIEIARERK